MTPTTDPNIHVVALQQAPAPLPHPSPSSSSGVTVPTWLVQLVPIIGLAAGAAGAFVTQRAEVEQMKNAIYDLKQQQSYFVQKQIFDLKLEEQGREQSQLHRRLDKIENLISGLYDRMPSNGKQNK